MKNNMMFVSLCALFIAFVNGQTTFSFSTVTPECPFPNDNKIYYPYPGNCSLYWVCDEGFLVVESCPPHLWWHQEITICDYPDDYCDDGTSPTQSPTELPTETSTIPTSEPTTEFPESTTHGNNIDPRCTDDNPESNLWPHPVYCNMYIECYHGGSYEMVCPDDLYFSDAGKKCDIADLSECCASSDQC